MNLAFVLYKYFPYGGLQRDFLRIAQACHARGYKVTAYALSWQGDLPEWLNLVISPVKAMTGPGKYRKFSGWLMSQLQQHPADAVIGFNKMPGLDVYYCADPCYEYKSRHLRSWWYRYSRRYRHFSRYEQAVFSRGQTPQILLISEIQKRLFVQYYNTEQQRLHLLPPGINKDRCAQEDSQALRKTFREEFFMSDDDLLLLQIGSGFRTKGVDRSIRGLAALPQNLKERAQLFVVGQDDPGEFKRLAKGLGVESRVRFFAGRDDIPLFLQGADLLVHPAYAENTGTVLLEAVVAGLPVLVTDVCGYARYIIEAGAGKVLPSPYAQENYNATLTEMLLADKQAWRDSALHFAKHADIYEMPERAADVVEQVLEKKSETISG